MSHDASEYCVDATTLSSRSHGSPTDALTTSPLLSSAHLLAPPAPRRPGLSGGGGGSYASHTTRRLTHNAAADDTLNWTSYILLFIFFLSSIGEAFFPDMLKTAGIDKVDKEAGPYGLSDTTRGGAHAPLMISFFLNSMGNFGCFTVAILMRQPGEKPLWRVNWLRALMPALVDIVSQALILTGLNLTTSATKAVVYTTCMAWSAVISRVLIRRVLSWWQWAAIGVVMCGLVLQGVHTSQPGGMRIHGYPVLRSTLSDPNRQWVLAVRGSVPGVDETQLPTTELLAKALWTARVAEEETKAAAKATEKPAEKGRRMASYDYPHADEEHNDKRGGSALSPIGGPGPVVAPESEAWRLIMGV